MASLTAEARAFQEELRAAEERNRQMRLRLDDLLTKQAQLGIQTAAAQALVGSP